MCYCTCTRWRQCSEGHGKVLLQGPLEAMTRLLNLVNLMPRRQTRHIGYDEDLSPSSQYLYRANKQAGRQALISGTTRKADAETLKHETLQLIKGETRRDPLMRTGLLDHVFNSTRMYSTAKTTCKASIRYGPLPLFIVPSMPCLLT